VERWHHSSTRDKELAEDHYWQQEDKPIAAETAGEGCL